MEDLGGPEGDHNVRVAHPCLDPHSLGEGWAEVGALRVEAPKALLNVWEASPVLDVEQRSLLEVPADDVGPTRELIVLKRLVQPDLVSELLEVTRLDLAHRRM